MKQCFRQTERARFLPSSKSQILETESKALRCIESLALTMIAISKKYWLTSIKVLSACLHLIAVFCQTSLSQDTPTQTVSGDAVVKSQNELPIVIKTTSRLAGAIDSLTWNGVEFIDSADHGRQLQSACAFNACGNEPFWAEAFNPTEAGSRRDGDGETSSSRLCSIEVRDNVLTTRNQTAYWLAPNEISPGPNSKGYPARNRTVLSNTHIEKRVTVGLPNLPQAIEYDVGFLIGEEEGCKDQSFTYAQFEVLTGYMPPSFHQFSTWNPIDGKVTRLSNQPGEQSLPIIFSNDSRSHAMAVYMPALDVANSTGPGYGRWDFKIEKVVKWNCVCRVRDEVRIQVKDYRFRVYVAVGTFDEVVATLMQLKNKSSR